MKQHLLTALALLTGITVHAQQTNQSWQNQDVTRRYIQYVPSVYNADNAVPLIIAMHGLGDNIANFSGVGFQQVADTANFIVVYPQGLKAFNPILASVFGPDSITAWNCDAGAFGLTLAPPVSDVEFINALIDTVSAHYNIDPDRIYATGFSMGGFMTNRLACELPRIKAIASVAGTIGGLLTCEPGRSVPACHFHGTAEGLALLVAGTQQALLAGRAIVMEPFLARIGPVVLQPVLRLAARLLPGQRLRECRESVG